MKNQLSTTPTKITHKMWSRTGRSGLAGPVNTAQERAMQEERERRISTKNNADFNETKIIVFLFYHDKRQMGLKKEFSMYGFHWS
jgi:hypothetical protein